MANLEETPAWQTILPLLSTMSIPALARKMNVPPGELAAALRRTDTARVAARAAGSPPPEPVDSRDEGDDLPPEPRAVVPVSESQPERAASSAHPEPKLGQRSSKLDRHRDLIGAMPDAAVAAKVGMSIQAVRNYRQKHGISAAGRRRTQEELEITSVAPLAASVPPHAGPGAQAGGGSWAWRVVFSGHAPRILLADDVATAAARAQEAGYGAVTLIERLHEAL
jgi:hypothetical protein